MAVHRLASEGLLEQMPEQTWSSWPEAHRDPQRRWLAFSARARVIVARKSVAPIDQWADLARPALAVGSSSSIAIADPRFGTTNGHFAALAQAWRAAAARGIDAPDFDRWLDGMRANGVRVLSGGNSATVEAVATGECAYGLTDTDDALAAIERGLPLVMSLARTLAPGVRGGGTMLIPNTVALIAGGPGDRPMGRDGSPPAEVLVATGQLRPFGIVIEAVGTALARESVDITAKVGNTVTAIRFQEGQRVAAGSVLVELDRAQTAAALVEAEAGLMESRNQFNRGRDLSVTQALSRAQLDQLETAVKTGEARVTAARSRLADTVIRAPFAGRTGLRRVSLGSLVSPGTVITTLDDSSVIKLEFTVPQSLLGSVERGLPIEAGADGFGERTFKGTLTTLDSRIDPVTRSITVRAELPNADGAIKPGLFMTVQLRAKTVPTLMIPEEALVPEQGRTFVFVVRDGKAQRLEVRTGGREPGSVAVLEGLTAQDAVIVEGTQRVRDGGEVVAKPRA